MHLNLSSHLSPFCKVVQVDKRLCLQTHTRCTCKQRCGLFSMVFFLPTVDLMLLDMPPGEHLLSYMKQLFPTTLRVQDPGGFLLPFTLLLPGTWQLPYKSLGIHEWINEWMFPKLLASLMWIRNWVSATGFYSLFFFLQLQPEDLTFLCLRQKWLEIIYIQSISRSFMIY